MKIHEEEKVDLQQKVLEHHMGLANKKSEAEKTQKLRTHNKIRRVGERVNTLAELSMLEKSGENLATMWSLLDMIEEELDIVEVEVKRMYLQ
ncbi:hypothetical protein EVJ32_04980 [Exiguobacterium sp. SH5S4]|uniref:hypothetical protein n=1 Tax=Exiguobacterium sp. SH5S4 TaxID=2510961 RepID=UPI001039F2E8|nr:hypothetical protein [Exiguobacterium sp. SH5S4]TCI26731.1 hypothetical protein EVJ32_04980 [Exiguobacterium sp. SH5S4]